MSKTPTVGAMVGFVPRDWEADAETPRPALITSLLDDAGTAHLTVFQPGGEVRSEHSVPHSREGAYHSWHALDDSPRIAERLASAKSETAQAAYEEAANA